MLAFLYSLRGTDQSVKKPRTRKNALNTRLALPDPKPSNTSSIGNTYHGASRLAEQGVNGWGGQRGRVRPLLYLLEPIRSEAPRRSEELKTELGVVVVEEGRGGRRRKDTRYAGRRGWRGVMSAN
jgi:hypothetical protein